MRRLLAPKWLLWHAATILVAVVFLRLGFWQWDRAVATRSPQNMGYALQWPVFALFAVGIWWRVVRDALHPPADAPPRERKPARRPAPEPAPAVPVVDEEDPELAAYNRYLSELDETARGSGR